MRHVQQTLSHQQREQMTMAHGSCHGLPSISSRHVVGVTTPRPPASRVVDGECIALSPSRAEILMLLQRLKRKLWNRDHMLRLLFLLLLISAAAASGAAPQDPARAGQSESVKFAVIGDTGTGAAPQYAVGQQMAAARATFPFEFVIMLGDNMYGRQAPQDFIEKFQRPYADLLQAGVLFYASLGNHDDQANRFYPGFHMDGQRYYTFAKKNVRFFVLDTNLLDRQQMAWLDDALGRSGDEWKICYFHHPLYSNARAHGGNIELRVALEPLLLKHGVDVVFAGHDHVYERLKPQKGINYFVAGSSGQLRKGDMARSETTAAAFDQDLAFMLVEIAAGVMRFEVKSRTGAIVDSGTINRRPTT
jgi:predicted phosphodiesterase